MCKSLVREEIATYGNATTLTDLELLGLVIGDEIKAKKILEDNDTGIGADLMRLLALPFQELCRMTCLSPAETCKIIAALELGVRFATCGPHCKIRVDSPHILANYLMPKLRYLQHEEFMVVCLNSKNYITATKTITKGTLTNSLVDPREVFNVAIMHHAAAIIVAHNHPSGDPTPSIDDKLITEMLAGSGMILSIPVNDHIIIGDGRYYSFKKEGIMPDYTKGGKKNGKN